jgi:YVTN family beta-propeller protein
VLAAVFVVVSLIAGALYAALGVGSGPGDVLPNSLAAIDPATNDVAAAVTVGVRPVAVVVAAGSVWVANSGDGTVARVEPKTLNVRRLISVEAHPRDVAAGLGAVWVAAADPAKIVRLDPRSGDVSRSAEVARCEGSDAGVAVGKGAVWMTCSRSGGAFRIDPQTLRTTHVARAGVALGTVSVTASPKASWVVDAPDEAVLRLDRQTKRLVATIHVGNRPVGVAVGAGRVWVTVQSK